MRNPIIQLCERLDIQIENSKDCFLYDINGKQYIDFQSGDWAANLGHSNDRINQVIKSQVDKLFHNNLRFRNKQSEELSIRILEKLAFENGKCVFLNSGSEAVNLGITIAKNLTQRNKIVKIDCSYLAAYGHGHISENNTDLLNVQIDNMEAISQIDFSEIAAFVFEPGNSSSLIRYPANDFIKSIAFSIKQNGGLLMANEVTTGFGRTGKWFGFQHYDFKPDIVATGKALGNGYPISCVSITNEVSSLFDKFPFRYAQSHQNDPLGCAVGLEVINVLENEGLINQGFEKGEYFKEQLLLLKAKHKNNIKDIRARGLMLSLEFYPSINGEAIYSQLLENGLFVGYKENVLRFLPPLIIERENVDELIETIDRIITCTE